jgi:uncharacterized protein YprB with RNaseH-like and TPR domain
MVGIMDLEDKLRNIARLSSSGRRGTVATEGKDRIVELLDGTIAENEFGEFVLVRKGFDQENLHREINLSSWDIGGELLASVCSSRKSAAEEADSLPFDLKEAVFIDCETTGLAGGVGTYAFLVGLGYLSGEEFWVEQHFMQDFHQERAVLSAVVDRLRDFKFLVSFNGKCYDVPLLQNRCVINRVEFDPADWTHFDLLFPCRRLWKRRIGECNLGNIEQKILGVIREIDVPSYLVPQIYFDYLRTGEAQPLIPVFHHNVYDIVSLLGLSVVIDQNLSAGSEGGDFSLVDTEDPLDLYSLGRIHRNLGNYEAGARCFRQALSGRLSPEWRLEVSLSLSFVYKKTGCTEDAAGIWQNLTEGDIPFSFSAHEELAKYYEHKTKDHPKAKSLVERAISQLKSDLSSSFTSVRQRRLNSLEYRKSRLERKIKKAAGCG